MFNSNIFVGSVLLLLLCATPVLAAPSTPSVPPPLSDEIIARSIVDMGNVSRLQAVMSKGRRSEPIAIAVMGGSITQGSAASSSEKNYGSLVYKWWKTTFPNAKVKFTNVGVGATGSDYGALRVERDLGKVKPDFVVVEFAVNDAQTPECAKYMEGLVRQLLKMESKPAVMLLFTMLSNGTNSQQWHSEVGRHYHLPMISMRDALWPEIEEGRLDWKTVEADEVHPNDTGHYYVAKFITSALARVLATLPSDDLIKASPALPEPLYIDRLESVSLLEGKALKPGKVEGWTYDSGKGGWKSKVPGSTMECEVSGSDVFLMAQHVNGPAGMFSVQVDEAEPTVVDCWFDQTWGTWKRLDHIASGLQPGAHKVTIKLLSDKNPNSKGNEVVINALGSSGVAK